MSEFQAKEWKAVKEKETHDVQQNVPLPHEIDAYTLNLIRSFGYIALHEAGKNQSGVDQLKGKLQLAPHTLRLDILEKSRCPANCETFTHGSMFLGSFTHKTKDYKMFASGIPSALPTEKTTGARAPFWAIEYTDKESEANCSFSTAISGLQIKSSKIGDWMNNTCATSDVMKVPMIVSSKAVKAGDTLKVFVPSKKQRTK